MADKISNTKQDEMAALTDEQLQAKTEALQRYQNGETLTNFCMKLFVLYVKEPNVFLDSSQGYKVQLWVESFFTMVMS